MVRAAVIGASGYAGQELVRLLQQHPEAELTSIGSRSYADMPFSHSSGAAPAGFDVTYSKSDISQAVENADLLFLALPHGIALKELTADILSSTKVIDLGADFRLRSQRAYETWYKQAHTNKELLDQAVYGLPEIHRDAIRSSQLIANPGCYTTCSILSLYPLLKESLVIQDIPIIIDAKSGVSGAGRSPNLSSHFPETHENIKAYKIGEHRHTPEIEQELSLAGGREVMVQFTPHLIPMNRGILSTSYLRLKKKLNEDDIYDLYQQHYRDEPFIKILPPGEGTAETRWVKASNRCDISFRIDRRSGFLVVVAAIDNLVKGASGQAIQNMNIIFGMEEQTGLSAFALFP